MFIQETLRGSLKWIEYIFQDTERFICDTLKILVSCRYFRAEEELFVWLVTLDIITLEGTASVMAYINYHWVEIVRTKTSEFQFMTYNVDKVQCTSATNCKGTFYRQQRRQKEGYVADSFGCYYCVSPGNLNDLSEFNIFYPEKRLNRPILIARFTMA